MSKVQWNYEGFRPRIRNSWIDSLNIGKSVEVINMRIEKRKLVLFWFMAKK